jgi:GntR family transcriptional regulator
MTGPVYRQIAEELRRRIETGELQPGSRLPTELELREMFENVSRNTVRDAVKSLANRGLVVTRPGQGTFVVDRVVPFAITMSTDGVTGLGGGEGVAYMSEARAQQRYPEATPPRVEIKTAAGVVARELQLADEAHVVARHQKLLIDGKPWCLQTSFYPMTFVEKGATRLVEANNIEPGTVLYVGERLGIKQVGYQDKVLARPPDEGEASFFRLRDGGVAVIESVRTAYETSGQPIRCTVTVWPADRNQLVYNIGAVPTQVTSTLPADDPSAASDGV